MWHQLKKQKTNPVADRQAQNTNISNVNILNMQTHFSIHYLHRLRVYQWNEPKKSSKSFKNSVIIRANSNGGGFNFSSISTVSILWANNAMPNDTKNHLANACVWHNFLFYLLKCRIFFSAINNNWMPFDQIFALHTNEIQWKRERERKKELIRNPFLWNWFICKHSSSKWCVRNRIVHIALNTLHRIKLCKSILIGDIDGVWTSNFYCAMWQMWQFFNP